MMPALSPFMTRGTISRWLKKEGEAFQAGDILLEIESEYATINVEAENPGIMGKILSPDGSTDVPVEQVIALVAKAPQEMVHMQAPVQMSPPPPPSHRQHLHFTNRGAANLEPAKGLMMASVHRTPSSFEIHHTIHSSGAATARGIVTDHTGSQHPPTSAPSAEHRPLNVNDSRDAKSPCTTTEATELRKTIVSTLSRRGSGAKSSGSTKGATAQYFEGLL